MNTKVCTGFCGRELPATTEFFHSEKRGLYGLKAQCKNCLNDKTKKWKQKNKDKQKQYYKNNKEKSKVYCIILIHYFIDCIAIFCVFLL